MPINTDTLNEAYDEAIRFCTKVEALRDATDDVGRTYSTWNEHAANTERAAVRRSSMDLTRALAKLRSRS